MAAGLPDPWRASWRGWLLLPQVVSSPTPVARTGLLHVPVEHEGNQNSSPEEAERSAEIVAGLALD
jgi:hypothetical protein